MTLARDGDDDEGLGLFVDAPLIEQLPKGGRQNRGVERREASSPRSARLLDAVGLPKLLE